MEAFNLLYLNGYKCSAIKRCWMRMLWYVFNRFRFLLSIYLTPNQKGGFSWKYHRLLPISWIFRKWTLEKNTLKNYSLFLNKFKARFDNQEIETITSDEILSFLIENSEGQKQTTKRFKFTLLKTFFNFFKNTVDQTFVNPCESPILSKTFRLAKGRQWTILQKDVVDEIIFKTDNPRNRLMLELMARGGMRIPRLST